MLFLTLTFVLMLTAALVITVGWAMRQLQPATEPASAWRQATPWVVKGLVTPISIWLVMNLGLSAHLQPFLPQIQAAQNTGGNWLPVYLRYTASGCLWITSYWAAISLVELLISAHRRIPADTRLEFQATCCTSLLVLGLPALLLLYLGGGAMLGMVLVLLVAPMIGYNAPLAQRPPPKPMYSRAMARMKMGKYGEAEQEILRQLEKADTDFDGWLLLAELHATRFDEVLEAEKIILDLCLHAEATPSQISVALHKLADWQIAPARDPEAAARSLQLISDRLPGTHLARMAELRRQQLPRNAEFRAATTSRPIPLPSLPTLMESPAAPRSPDSPPAQAQLQRLTEQLTRDPNSISDREQFARLLAEALNEPALAIEQLELLLGLGTQPEVKQLEWLGLIADWQMRLLHDATAAQGTWRRMIALKPNSPQAFAAQRHLSLSQAEAAARTRTAL